MTATLPCVGTLHRSPARHRCRGNRLAEHPPACANVCVAASTRPLANTQVGTFDATRQSSVAQLAEQPAVNRQVTGSSPVGGARSPVAQLAEQPAVNRQVTGSSPVGRAAEEDPSGVLFHVPGNRAGHGEVLMVVRSRPSEAGDRMSGYAAADGAYKCARR